ncbi:MAG TPA: HAMP domain-containing protein [Methylomirabilota bacterium]
MSPLTDPPLEQRSQYRRNLFIVSGGLALLAVAWWGFKVWIHSPQVPLASNLAVFALFNLNLIVFLLLVVLLFRNLVKLAFERRQKVLGARFKAKLVIAFLSLTLTPAILIFIIASNFINTSIEGWFKPQVERPLDQALQVAQTYYQGQEAMTLRHARYMADVLAREGFLAPAQRAVLATYLNGQQERLGLAAITVFNRAGQPVLHAKDAALASVPTRSVNKEQLRRGLGGQDVTTVHELDDGDMIQAIVPIKTGDRAVLGALVVGTYVPQRLETRLRGISQSFQEYKQLRLLKQPLKGIYILLFLLMTLVIVFSATWFGLYLARGITEPVQMLAEGTRAVAAGNLNYKVTVRADDELGVLVDSFNRMTSDLALSQTRLEHTYRDLQAKHEEVEQRRRRAHAWRLGDGGARPTLHHHPAAAGPFGARGADPAHEPPARERTRARGAPSPRRPLRDAARIGDRAQGARRRLPRHGPGLRRSDRAPQGPAPGRVARGRPAHRP